MLRDISLVMLISGFLLLFISVLLIFVFKVPELIDELSGRKAKRQIKMLHELNMGTGSLDKLSTSEIYSSIPSGSLLVGEMSNITKEKFAIYNEDEIDTCDMYEDNQSNVPTSVMSEEMTGYVDEEVTGFMESVQNFYNTKKSINVLEEYSSLGDGGYTEDE